MDENDMDDELEPDSSDDEFDGDDADSEVSGDEPDPSFVDDEPDDEKKSLSETLTLRARKSFKPDISALCDAVDNGQLLLEVGAKLIIEYPDDWRDTMTWTIKAIDHETGNMRLYNEQETFYGGSNYKVGPERGLVFKIPGTRKAGVADPMQRKVRLSKEERRERDNELAKEREQKREAKNAKKRKLLEERKARQERRAAKRAAREEKQRLRELKKAR